jgi:vacuolar-type H+-ATPase subunit E/Vma4
LKFLKALFKGGLRLESLDDDSIALDLSFEGLLEAMEM